MPWVLRMAWLPACSLAACGFLTDTSGLTGGESGGADGGNNEAGVDALGASDAGTDAVADGGDAACPGHARAIVCDNFDDGPLGARWSSKGVSDATLVLSQAQASSAPSSLFSEVTTSDAGAMRRPSACLQIDVARPLGNVRSSFDVYFDLLGSYSAALGGVYVNDGLKSYGLTLLASNTAMKILEDGTGDLADGGSTAVLHPFPLIPLGAWTRVVLDIDFNGSDAAAPTFTLTLERPPGTSASPVLDHIPIVRTVTGFTATAFAGLQYQYVRGASGPTRVYVDNVVIEERP